MKLTLPRNSRFLTIWVLLAIGFLLTGNASLFGEDDSEPQQAVFTVKLIDGNKEVAGVLKMHFKKNFEAEWDNGLFIMDFDRIEEIKPVDAVKKRVTVKLVSGEEIQVKLINALFLDKTVFGKYELHLDKIKTIVRKK